jgi:hypothetical protein
VQLAEPELVDHATVVHRPGSHLPFVVPAEPKHTAPTAHGKFGIVPNISVSVLPSAVLLPADVVSRMSVAVVSTTPSGTRCRAMQ